MKWIAVTLAAAFVLSACADEPGSSDLLTNAAEAREPALQQFSPPALTVTSDDGAVLELQPFAYCWSGADVSLCADGDPWLYGTGALSGDASFAFDWPLEGWSWTVEARTRENSCESALPRLTNLTPGEPVPAPPVGDLVVVAGRGPEGDASFAFQPAFRSAPGLPDLSAVVLFAPSGDGTVTAAELAVWVSNVPVEPDAFAADAFIQGAEGRIAQFELIPERRQECWSGSLYAAVDPEAALINLPGFRPPITVSVDLIIDGRALRSRQVVWPDDFPAISPQSPNLVLRELGG